MVTPDMIKAFLDQLRLCPALVTLGAEVLTVRPSGAAGGNAVVVEVVGFGGSDARGQWLPRVQLVCFGAGAAADFATQQRLGTEVWRAADDWLMAHDGARTQGFRGADCVVPVIGFEGWGRTIDAPSRRPVTVANYRPRVKAAA